MEPTAKIAKGAWTMTTTIQDAAIRHGDRVTIDRERGMAPIRGLVTDVFEGQFGKLYEITEFRGDDEAIPHYFSEFDSCMRNVEVER